MSTLIDYVKIARPDHWLKNIFVLPGVPLALFFFPEFANTSIIVDVLLGFLATCIVSSSNYVINELLDSEYDQHHPVKKFRPLAIGSISRPIAYAEWIILAVLGIGLGFYTNELVGWWCLALWVAATLYNIPPIRTKELPFLDVLSEATNNPIRLAIGWYSVGATVMMPLSALFAYWMLGAFLMATKRFAEYRRIDDPERAIHYRRSFAYYNEERLMVGIVFYIALFVTGATTFIMQYKYELALCMPFLAYMIAYYVYLGFQPDSPVQYPERLYKEKQLMFSLVLCTALGLILFFVNFPFIEQLFIPLAH